MCSRNQKTDKTGGFKGQLVVSDRFRVAEQSCKSRTQVLVSIGIKTALAICFEVVVVSNWS